VVQEPVTVALPASLGRRLLRQRDIDIGTIQDLLGDTNLTTTRRYVGVTNERRCGAIAGLE
jgi:site-specific recombinase XerD